MLFYSTDHQCIERQMHGIDCTYIGPVTSLELICRKKMKRKILQRIFFLLLYDIVKKQQQKQTKHKPKDFVRESKTKSPSHIKNCFELYCTKYSSHVEIPVLKSFKTKAHFMTMLLQLQSDFEYWRSITNIVSGINKPITRGLKQNFLFVFGLMRVSYFCINKKKLLFCWYIQ